MLSDDKIIELIHIKTYAYLSTANYSTLRQHCLEQQALSVIMEQTQNHVDLLVENEKRKYFITQASIACSQQQQQDIDEIRHDTEEAEIEKRLCITFNKELTDINDEIEQTRREKSKQEELLNNITPLIDILAKQIRQLRAAKSSHEHSHAEHGPQNTNQAHNHSHLLHAPAHKELLTALSPVPAEAQSQLMSQKELMEAQHGAAQKKLEDCHNTIQKLTQRQSELNVKLTSEIPQKQQARRERLSARQSRELARLNPESIQAQLSPTNYLLLTELVREFNILKESQGKQAVARAGKHSYKEYIYCLINTLQTNKTLSLSFHEITALKQIAQLMQKCLDVADEEKNKLATLKTELQTKWRLDNILSNSEEELLCLQRANPMLTNQNSRFDEDNRKLAQTINERLENRNYLLKIGAGILLLTLITAALAFIAGLELIFFTPSALCATATLGLFVTSLIYTAQNNSDRYQLKQNQGSITANSKKISSQTEKIDTLEKSIIPELKIQISDAQVKIEKLRRALEEFQAQRQLFLSKASNVILSKASNIYPTPSSSTVVDLEEYPLDENYNPKPEADNISYRL
jgi:hypothetical protein